MELPPQRDEFSCNGPAGASTSNQANYVCRDQRHVASKVTSAEASANQASHGEHNLTNNPAFAKVWHNLDRQVDHPVGARTHPQPALAPAIPRKNPGMDDSSCTQSNWDPYQVTQMGPSRSGTAGPHQTEDATPQDWISPTARDKQWTTICHSLFLHVLRHDGTSVGEE